jgi:hypothetical protein
VPEPDISSLSDSTSEGLESSSEELDSRPDPQAHWIARLAEIHKRNNAVRDTFERSTGVSGQVVHSPACAHPAFVYGINHNKNDPESRSKRQQA